MVPDRGHELPLVDQLRAITLEQERRRQESRGARLIVHVEAHVAARRPAGRLGLPAPAPPFDRYGPGRAEMRGQLGIDGPGAVDNGRFRLGALLVEPHL
jgi:hypothetical protein